MGSWLDVVLETLLANPKATGKKENLVSVRSACSEITRTSADGY